MLLSFSASNYKSFVQPFIFDMKPAPKQKDLEYSILKENVGNKTLQGLSTAVIYGPNASGKSNIIGSMHAMKMIVERGHIRNNREENNPDPASSSLELIPNCFLKEAKPVELSVEFTHAGKVFKYCMALDLGTFFATDHPRKIEEESLWVNGKRLFLRTSGNTIEIDVKAILIYSEQTYTASQVSLLLDVSKRNLDSQDLFLTNGFKTVFSPDLVTSIMNWFEKKFLVFYRADILESEKKLSDPNDESLYVNKQANTVAQAFGVTSSNLGFFAPKGETVARLYSIFPEKKKIIPIEDFESYGTVRFMNLFPLLQDTLKTGATLVLDEFDASLHPMAVMSILTIFHNDEINTNNAQLIFNTQNPIFLNANLLRRDEIKFVERVEETKESQHYSLAEFGTSGVNGVRRGEDYLTNYFISKYGAISDIDLTPLFKKLEPSDG